MSGKLDQSLDEIMKDRKPAAGGRRARSGRLPNRKAAIKSKAATTAVIAPAGGVQKKTKGPKPTKAAATTALTGESKISVSNLPQDVNEAMIKDYFTSTVAPVKKVILNYGPNGMSRGNATVSFNKPTAAAESVKLDGTKVDGRAMRIEVLVGAKSIPPPQPPKALSDRVQPKNAAQEQKKGKKKEGAAKTGAAAATTNGAAAKGKKKSGRAGRPKPKTAQELDAEMHDYFGGDAPATNVAAPAANGDTGMTDEVL